MRKKFKLSLVHMPDVVIGKIAIDQDIVDRMAHGYEYSLITFVDSSVPEVTGLRLFETSPIEGPS